MWPIYRIASLAVVFFAGGANAENFPTDVTHPHCIIVISREGEFDTAIGCAKDTSYQINITQDEVQMNQLNLDGVPIFDENFRGELHPASKLPAHIQEFSHELQSCISDNNCYLNNFSKDTLTSVGRIVENAKVSSAVLRRSVYFGFSPNTISFSVLVGDGDGERLIFWFGTGSADEKKSTVQYDFSILKAD
ncbi:hypothetical protein [Phaeobacter sp. LSS9]|uniref:hypothetical protein n=1 Tax=unclassified Phaeobacter TaxID=2621772 RepID=UPI0013C2C40F|nr:hypothetical protein [Phaeobacter sp. LSS9]